MITESSGFLYLTNLVVKEICEFQRAMSSLKMKNILEFNRILFADFSQRKINLLIDASGIRIIGRSVWFSLRVKRAISRRECDKVHLAVCSDVLFVMNWRITNGNKHDSPFFRLLVAPFKLFGLVLADKGYSSRRNHQLSVDKKGALFAPLEKLHFGFGKHTKLEEHAKKRNGSAIYCLQYEIIYLLEICKRKGVEPIRASMNLCEKDLFSESYQKFVKSCLLLKNIYVIIENNCFC